MTKEKDGGIQVYFRDKEGNKIIPKKHRLSKKFKSNVTHIWRAACRQESIEHREAAQKRTVELMRNPSLITDETWKEVSIY